MLLPDQGKMHADQGQERPSNNTGQIQHIGLTFASGKNSFILESRVWIQRGLFAQHCEFTVSLSSLLFFVDFNSTFFKENAFGCK